jgi:hypothetical protein
MRKVLVVTLAALIVLAFSNVAMAGYNPAIELNVQDTATTPNTNFWFPHYLLAPGDVSWTEYTYGNSFTIDYPPGQPTFNVTSTDRIVSDGIVRYGSTTWKGDIFLAVETTETVKYYFQWWPYVNIPGQGGVGVPYKVKWVGDPWDPDGYWQRLSKLDP